MLIDSQIDISSQITSLRDDLIRFKTSQPTIGDSSKLYSQTFDAGIFPRTQSLSQKNWKIECIPKNNESVAIFMAYCSDDLPAQAVTGYIEVPLSTNNVYYWSQSGYWNGGTTPAGLLFTTPRYFTVYSNVEFNIKTELIGTA